MIAYIKGKIKFKGENFVVLENNGIGYQIFIPQELLLKIEIGDAMEFFMHQHVREDALQLFGFATAEELKLFELLISISGIGPKTGLGVLSVAKVGDIKSAIINQDASILKKVSGIGAKMAERIILELKNKVAGIVGVGDIKSKEEMGADADAIDALVALGYAREKAREVLKKTNSDLDIGERVKEALRIIRE
ncbi:Holliday junction branch migration protein RuvA [Candidatus Falkowbacteria bacterium]|nr:Holliday junction branch migration protein RuvA [Candidatus Falkowbacteria bacterium]